MLYAAQMRLHRPHWGKYKLTKLHQLLAVVTAWVILNGKQMDKRFLKDLLILYGLS